MIRPMLFLLLFGCLIAPAFQPIQAPTPTLTATWQPAGLRVVWSGAPADACLYLVGGGLRDAWLDCGASGDVLLADGGVDTDYAPQKRAALELRGPDEVTVARLAVPARVVILPIVVAP